MLSVFLVSFAAAAFSYEWSGIFPKTGTFDNAEASMKWYVQKVGAAQTYGTAGDMSMKLVIMDGGAAATRTALDAKKIEGEALIAGTTCGDVESGATLTVDTTTGSCYNLKFNADLRESEYTITKPAGVKTLVFFGEHDPHEFEDADAANNDGKHYFQDAAAADIEPAAMGPTLWEWSGVFATPKDEYTWVAQKIGGATGSYADEYMYLIALDAAAADEATLDGLATKAKAGYAAECVAKAATGGSATVAGTGPALTPTDGACFKLVFDQVARESTWKINTAGKANVAFFAQHVPIEFEDSAADDGKHYFLDESTSPATDVEAGFDELSDGGAMGHHHASDDGHGKTCGCESEGAIPFNIDCSKTDAAQQYIRDAMTDLSACEKAVSCKTIEKCQMAFFIIQSHHDHCDHETLLKAEETTMHDYEAFCTNCQIYREYVKGNEDCFFMPADADKFCGDIITDTKPVDDALALLEAGCTIEGACCTSPALIGAFSTIVAYHDLCDPNDLPVTVEKAFHDYEEGCEDHFCNMIGADYNGKSCDGLDSHAALFGLLAAAVLAA
jgi:hypothetical protein